VSVKGTLIEDKMRRFLGECAHFSFNKCPIHTHDGASATFSTNLHKTDNSAGWADFTILMESTPAIGSCHSVYSVDLVD
jgi:hypothetical protein